MRFFSRTLIATLILTPFILLKEVEAQSQKIKKANKFELQQVLTLDYEGTIFKLPYGYIYDDGVPELHLKAVNVLKYYTPSFQYLWPSYGPVPKQCTRDIVFCDAPPVRGFKKPKKGKKQFVVWQRIHFHAELKDAENKRQLVFDPIDRDREIKEGLYKILKKMGVEELQFGNITYCRALNPNYRHLFIHCFEDWCRISAPDPDKSWTHIFNFNRAHIGKWREIYEGRKRILKMFPPQ